MDGRSDVNGHAHRDARLEPDPEAAFKRLPPRIMPEEMVETQAVTHADSPVHSGTETEWALRVGGGG